MKLGLGSYGCAWAVGVPGAMPERPLTAVGMVEWAAALGLRLIQIADNIPLEKFSDSGLNQLVAAARAHSVDVELGTRGIDPAHLRRFLELCGLFRSPLLRVVVDTATHNPSPDEVVSVVRQILPDLKAAGVTLAIENHDRFPVSSLARIIREVDSRHVGICLDSVNSFGSLEGPAVVVETLAPAVVNLHVKDFAVRRASHSMGFTIEGTPAGEGRLDVPWLIETLRRAGRNPNAILELWPPPESGIEATVAKERQWVETSVRYLRGLIPD